MSVMNIIRIVSYAMKDKVVEEMIERTGGPAFPNIVAIKQTAGQDWPETVGGMSLRDFFAAHVLTGMMNPRNLIASKMDFQKIADMSFKLADAMLAEREKKVPPIEGAVCHGDFRHIRIGGTD